MDSSLQQWLQENGIVGQHVHAALTTMAGVTTIDDMLILEDEDFKEMSVEAHFTLLERRKLINAVRRLRQDRRAATPAPEEKSPAPQPTPSETATERSATPTPDPTPRRQDPDEIMMCLACQGSFPAREGGFNAEKVWYCGKCVKERGIQLVDPDDTKEENSEGAGAERERRELPDRLKLLAALLGAASGDLDLGSSAGPPVGAGTVDSDEFAVTRDNVIDICRALDITICRTLRPDLFQFENNFGKIFCRIDNNGTNKCVIHTYAYFKCQITKREDKLKFSMQWNVRHTFTKLQVDSDDDLCMESDLILPEPQLGQKPTRGDMKEMMTFLNSIWQQSIVTFHIESGQFAAQHGGASE